jgi:zinc-binding in reverse transcriptase
MRINKKRLVGSSTSILFWFDVWFREILFYILFSNLFTNAKSPGVITVVKIWNNGNIKIPLTRGSLLLRWEKSEVISILSSLSDNFLGQDSAVWSLTSFGVYTVRLVYLFFMHTKSSNTNLLYLWELKISLKIKCFMWLVLHGKILTRSNLVQRGWGTCFLPILLSFIRNNWSFIY